MASSPPPPSVRPLTIAEVMKVAPPTVRHDAHFAAAQALMRGHDVRHLPVLDAERRLVVAPGDLVADVAREMAERGLDCAVVVDRGQVVGLFTASDSPAHPAARDAL